MSCVVVVLSAGRADLRHILVGFDDANCFQFLTPPLPLPYKGLLFIHISGLGEGDDFEVLIESV